MIVFSAANYNSTILEQVSDFNINDNKTPKLSFAGGPLKTTSNKDPKKSALKATAYQTSKTAEKKVVKKVTLDNTAVKEPQFVKFSGGSPIKASIVAKVNNPSISNSLTKKTAYIDVYSGENK